jgi:hypothetical protein
MCSWDQLLHHPSLALVEKCLQVGLLALGQFGILLNNGPVKGRPGVIEQHTQSNREAFVDRHVDQHHREAAVGDVVFDDARCCPVSVYHINDMELQIGVIKR